MVHPPAPGQDPAECAECAVCCLLRVLHTHLQLSPLATQNDDELCISAPSFWLHRVGAHEGGASRFQCALLWLRARVSFVNCLWAGVVSVCPARGFISCGDLF